MTARKAATNSTNSTAAPIQEMVNVMTSEILAIPSIELRAGDNFGGVGEFFRYSILTKPEIDSEVELFVDCESGVSSTITRSIVTVQVFDISKNVRGYVEFDGEEIQKVQRFTYEMKAV